MPKIDTLWERTELGSPPIIDTRINFGPAVKFKHGWFHSHTKTNHN